RLHVVLTLTLLIPLVFSPLHRRPTVNAPAFLPRLNKISFIFKMSQQLSVSIWLDTGLCKMWIMRVRGAFMLREE
ncbi:cystathionine gamma-synthase, partial [Moniliophthora roreri]